MTDYVAYEPQFIERAYGDALNLVQETTIYLNDTGAREKMLLSEGARLTFTVETLRHSTRLMQATAWLLTHKAVASGELTAAEALASERLLAGRDICLERDLEGEALLPGKFQNLLEDGFSLYGRVVRLEASLLASDPRNHVHELLDRLRS